MPVQLAENKMIGGGVKMNGFMTIKELAKTGLASETYLRQLVKQQRCPGVYAGTRFYVNVSMLEEQLRQESIPKNVQQCESLPR